MSNRSERELLADLITLKAKADEVFQQIFCPDNWAEDNMMLNMLRTLQELRDKIVKIDAQLDKMANDDIASTVASLWEQ